MRKLLTVHHNIEKAQESANPKEEQREGHEVREKKGFAAFRAKVESLQGDALKDKALELVGYAARLTTADFMKAKLYMRQRLGAGYANDWASAVSALQRPSRHQRYTADVLAKMILKQHNFAQDAGNRLYRYRDGVYRGDGTEFVQEQVKEILEERSVSDQWTRYLSKEVAEYIRVGSPTLSDHPPPGVLNLKNGLFYIGARTLRPHTPNLLSSIQFPIEYDPEATCEELDKWIEQTLDKDEWGVLYEVTAWVMMPDNPKDQALMLRGDGANGKSICLAVVGAFLGPENTAAISLQKLNSNRFAANRLVGISANICPDLPTSHVADTGTFKRITGGDPVNTEYKFGKDFDFVPFCKLLFSANETPTSNDTSEGYFRRWVILPFEHTFDGQNREKRETLLARITAPHQLSGLLNKALTTWNIVAEHGITSTEKMKDALLEFKEESSPVIAWLGSILTKDPDSTIECSVMYEKYCDYARRHRRRIPSAKEFGKKVRQFYPGMKIVIRASSRKTGKRTKHYSGLEWV